MRPSPTRRYFADAVAVLDQNAKIVRIRMMNYGCGVGFKLIQALAENRNQTIEDLVLYLDLVATTQLLLILFRLQVKIECWRNLVWK